MKEKFIRVKNFVLREVWAVDTSEVSKFKRAYIGLIQIINLGVIGFRQDKLNLRASALTYFTVLSIVPVVALGFGIAKGFGLEELLERELVKNFAGQEQVLEYLLKFTGSMLDTAKGGYIAGFGLALLLWSVIKLLTNIENSFNTVWEVKKARSFFRKFTDYMSIMLLGPIFFILSSSVTIFISTQLSRISRGELFDFASPLFLKFAQIIPYFIMWILFTVLFLIMPNTKVKFKSALVAGIISGTIFQAFQALYVFFQSGATRMSAIYGSFAALPLFLIWMQISWFVVLLGAEISYAVQNVKTKGASIFHKNLSISYQKKIAGYLMSKIVERFEKGEKAYTTVELSVMLKIPVYTVDFVLYKLAEAQLLSKIDDDDNNLVFQPARTTQNIDLCDVFFNYDDIGNDNSKYHYNGEYQKISRNFDEIRQIAKKSSANILIKEFVNTDDEINEELSSEENI